MMPHNKTHAAATGRFRSAGGWSSWSTRKRIIIIGGTCAVLFMLYTMIYGRVDDRSGSSTQPPRGGDGHVHEVLEPMDPAIVQPAEPVTTTVVTPTNDAPETQPEVVYTTRQGRSAIVTKIQILSETPHDPSAFTQGLCFYRGELYESTGLNGRSTLRKVDLKTGQTLRQLKLKQEHFAEGLTIWRDLIYQLTWNSRVGFVYDLKFQYKRTFPLPGEGWGLTHNQRSLIISDGSSSLFFMSPKTFKIKRTLEVREITAKGLQPIEWLNELEYIDGYIWANVWYHNMIIVIHPLTGIVHKKIQLGSLRPNPNQEAVPNGIAFDHATRQLYITGKLWPTLYHVQLDTLGLTVNATAINDDVPDDRELVIDDNGALVQHDA